MLRPCDFLRNGVRWYQFRWRRPSILSVSLELELNAWKAEWNCDVMANFGKGKHAWHSEGRRTAKTRTKSASCICQLLFVCWEVNEWNSSSVCLVVVLCGRWLFFSPPLPPSDGLFVRMFGGHSDWIFLLLFFPFKVDSATSVFDCSGGH